MPCRGPAGRGSRVGECHERARRGSHRTARGPVSAWRQAAPSGCGCGVPLSAPEPASGSLLPASRHRRLSGSRGGAFVEAAGSRPLLLCSAAPHPWRPGVSAASPPAWLSVGPGRPSVGRSALPRRSLRVFLQEPAAPRGAVCLAGEAPWVSPGVRGAPSPSSVTLAHLCDPLVFQCKWSRKGFVRTRWCVADWYVYLVLFIPVRKPRNVFPGCGAARQRGRMCHQKPP